jgi:hypothetical protein
MLKQRLEKHLELAKRQLTRKEYAFILKERGLSSREINLAWMNAIRRRG